MNSHILFRTNVEKAAGHDIMFLFQIGKYLWATGIYWSGTIDNTEFSLSNNTKQSSRVQKQY
jgi:hypothetical protein